MGDRIISINIVDIVSGEEATYVYNATTKALTQQPNSAIQVKIVSDKEEEE